MVDFVKDNTERLSGRKVKLVCTDGEIHIGVLGVFTSKFDNDEGVASVDIDSDKFDGLTLTILKMK